MNGCGQMIVNQDSEIRRRMVSIHNGIQLLSARSSVHR